MEDRKSMAERGAENDVKGKGNDLKGRLKDAAGGLTGDSKLQAEGKLDRAKGKAQDALGDVQRRAGRRTSRNGSTLPPRKKREPGVPGLPLVAWHSRQRDEPE